MICNCGVGCRCAISANVARRFDGGRLRNPRRTPTGGILLEGACTRTGVLPYKLGDGTTRRELRPPEEVFSSDSIASLKAAAVTDLHPSEPVTADNWKAVSVGHIDAPRQQSDHLVADIAIQDGATIRKVDSGERVELSSGYVCDLEMTQGVWNGQRYDAIQRNIRYNHVALGPIGWGRAGTTVSLRLDSADAVLQESTTVDKITIDGKEYTVGSPEAAAALAKLEATRDEAKSRADSLTKEVEGYRLAAAKEARTKLIAKAQTIGFKCDDAEAVNKMSDKDIMIQTIKLVRPDFDPTDKSDDYIRASFDMVQTPLQSLPPAPAPALDSIHNVRGGSPAPAPQPVIVDDAEDARKKMRLDNREGWQKPIPGSFRNPAVG